MTTTPATTDPTAAVDALGLDRAPSGRFRLLGADPVLPTSLPLGLASATAIGLGAATAAELARVNGVPAQVPAVDLAAAATTLLGFAHLRVAGRSPGRDNAGNPTVAPYRCADGRWIHLHGGFPHLARGTEAVLGCREGADAAELASAVARWRSDDLESSLASAGQCGALHRTADEWAAHPQGRALAVEPVVAIRRVGDAPPAPVGSDAQPLGGTRVLDLTRVLAGPTCGRTLASYGADVLRIDGPHLPDLPTFTIETGSGKRSAHLDLRDASDRDRLDTLAAGADVVIDGYRDGALGRYGLEPDRIAREQPGTVLATIRCYGDVGPHAGRPGWEQLAQAATGMAVAHSNAAPDGSGVPHGVPAAVNDYTTGYLAAFGVLEALRRRTVEGGTWHVAVSLCRTAMWVMALPVVPGSATVNSPAPTLEAVDTPWGVVHRLPPVPELPVTPARWGLPPVPPGTHDPVWLPR